MGVASGLDTKPRSGSDHRQRSPSRRLSIVTDNASATPALSEESPTDRLASLQQSQGGSPPARPWFARAMARPAPSPSIGVTLPADATLQTSGEQTTNSKEMRIMKTKSWARVALLSLVGTVALAVPAGSANAAWTSCPNGSQATVETRSGTGGTFSTQPTAIGSLSVYTC